MHINNDPIRDLIVITVTIVILAGLAELLFVIFT